VFAIPVAEASKHPARMHRGATVPRDVSSQYGGRDETYSVSTGGGGGHRGATAPRSEWGGGGGMTLARARDSQDPALQLAESDGAFPAVRLDVWTTPRGRAPRPHPPGALPALLRFAAMSGASASSSSSCAPQHSIRGDFTRGRLCPSDLASA
jgi:hypothetical protein